MASSSSSSSSPHLTVTLLDGASREELDCLSTAEGDCFIGQAECSFHVRVRVHSAPTPWLLCYYIDGAWVTSFHGHLSDDWRTCRAYISSDGKKKYELMFGSSRMVKAEGTGVSSSSAASSTRFGEVRVDLHPMRTQVRKLRKRTRDSYSPPPSVEEDEDDQERRPLSSEQLQTREGVKFFQQPGLCATLGDPATTAGSFYSEHDYEVKEVLPVVCSCTVRYDLADHLILRGVLSESHGLWSKYAPQQGEGEAEGEDAAEPDARRMRLLKALLPPGYSLTRSVARERPAGAPPVVDLTGDGEGEDEDEESEGQLPAVRPKVEVLVD